MKKLIPILITLSLALAACSGGATPTPTEAPPIVVDDFAVMAEGRLLPRDTASLTFGAGGYVTELLASEGMTLTTGQVVARLDNTAALAQVAQAELEVLNAQQALTDLHENAALITAQAQAAIAQAQDNLEHAQKQLRNIQNPASEALYDAVDDAQLALETAQAVAQLANVSPEAQAYEQALVATDIAFRNYQHWQAEYDKNPSDELLDVVEQTRAAYQAALDNQLALELTINTDKANKTDAATEAQERYDDAVANLNSALVGPNAIKLALAQSNVALAEATLTDAQANWEKVQAGPDAALVALAEARLTTAQAALAAAQMALTNTELRTTMAGTLIDFDLKVGALASPGQPVGSLADFSAWIVETDNLTEIEVVKLTEGQGVTIKFDALPDAPLRGEIESISDVFQDKRGDVTYTIKIRLTETHPQMRWGMTAEVTFDK